MKLQNKDTGEIGIPRVEYQEFYIDTENGYTYNYNSLHRMYEEWEDAPKDPKNVYFISSEGIVFETYDEYYDWENEKQIGNYFETREEADKAVEKLKAWKRLKDKGFRFRSWRSAYLSGAKYVFTITAESDSAGTDILNLLFSGGEE